MKIIKMAAAILAAAAMLTACGQIEDDDSVNTTKAPADQVADAQGDQDEAQEEPQETAEDTEKTEETESAEDTEATTEAPAEETQVAETAAAEEEQRFDGIDGNSYTFAELTERGQGNTLTDGTQFVIVPDGGGAGHAYYKLFTKAPEGEWTQGQVYDEINGTNYHVALLDGSILLISSGGAASPDFPLAYRLTLNDDAIERTELTDFFDLMKDQVPAVDGMVLAEVKSSTITTAGVEMEISFTDSERNEIYSGSFTVDENTQLTGLVG